jgi:hypothetical protein
MIWLSVLCVSVRQKLYKTRGWIDDELEARLRNQNLSEDRLNAMVASGYSTKDIDLWTSILAGSSSIQAVAKLNNLYKADPNIKVPSNILSLILDLGKIDQLSLRTLSIYINATVHLHHGELILQLLRKISQTWPDGLPFAASIFSQWVAKEKLDEYVQINNLHNQVLCILAGSSEKAYFSTILSRHKAQLQILSDMTNHHPQLQIMRSGYRALITVRLALPKTKEDREWAALKAESWPPWKEERLGIEYPLRRSSAMQVLHHMQHVGYGWTDWEKQACIYAGWDTDDSPTIQTRNAKQLFGQDLNKRPDPTDFTMMDSDRVWAARIRSTRTTKEAWAGFLHSPPSQEVYHAMFERLLFPVVDALSKEVIQESSSLTPGDIGALTPAPKDPYNDPYLTKPVPSVQGLFEDMLEKGVSPSERVLGLLVKYSPDADKIISQACDIPRDKVFEQESLMKLPQILYSATIGHLCAQPVTSMVNGRPAIVHATMMASFRSPSSTMFSELLKALSVRLCPEATDTIPWDMMKQLILRMQDEAVPVDFNDFFQLCNGLNRIINTLRQRNKSIEVYQERVYLYELFQKCVGDMDSDTPLSWPTYGQLWAYIRIMSHLDDKDHYRRVIAWAIRNKNQMEENQDGTLSEFIQNALENASEMGSTQLDIKRWLELGDE